MKRSIVIGMALIITGCSNFGYSLAEVTGLSFLHDRRTSRAMALDERIEDSAILELHAIKAIKERAHFNITSYNGKVLVTGEAETEAIRDQIVANIRIIAGVKIVHNEMIVSSLSSLASRAKDALITTRVKEALAKITGLPGFDVTRIKVVTERKIVYLMGLVHQEEGDAAAKIVQNVSEVSKIVTLFEYIDYTKRK